MGKSSHRSSESTLSHFVVMSLPSPGATTAVLHRPEHSLRTDLPVAMGLLMSTLGAGLLSVPFPFAVLPHSAAVALVIVVGTCMALTAQALLYAHVSVVGKRDLRMVAADAASYRSMAWAMGGERVADVVAVIMACGIFGGCVGCIRIVRDMTPFLAELLLHGDDSETMGHHGDDGIAMPGVYGGGDATIAGAATDTPSTLSNVILWATFVVIVWPLCSLQKLSMLKVSNALGLLCSLLLVVAVVYRARTQPWTAPVVVLNDGEHAYDGDDEAPILARVAQSISIFSYAFTMHLNLLPLFVQLRGGRDGHGNDRANDNNNDGDEECDEPLGRSRARMTRYIVAVAVVCMLLYITFGLSAARLYGALVRGNVLINMKSDPFMRAPLLAVFAAVVLTFPPLFHPQRVIVEELLFKRVAVHQSPLPLPLPTHSNSNPNSQSPPPLPRQLGPRSRAGVAAALLLAEMLVAIWVPGIEVVFAFVGASTTVLICYGIPVLLFTTLVAWCHTRGGTLWCATLWLIVAAIAVMGVHTILFLAHA